MKTIAQQLNVKEFPLTINDSKGNRIYYEKENGYWVKRKFDSKGNEIHYENSFGFWHKREYDFEGNEVYFKNSTGYWEKKEFDSKGNEVYFEDSQGSIIDKRKIPEYTWEDLFELIGNFKLIK